MAGWFELSKSSNDQFRFVLKAGNGEIILTSELYTTRASAENGIASVRTNSPLDERYEKKTATNVLVQASDLKDAIKKLDEGMKDSMADYVIASVSETKIMDVYKYVGPDSEEKENTTGGIAGNAQSSQK